MHTLRNSVRRVYRFSPRRGSLVYHRNASRIAIPFEQPEFPVIESCPPPTCPCREKPTGLEIDRDTNLNGSIGTYAQQVLISTGRSIWKSRIEEDDDALLLKLLKSFLGRGGKYSNVCSGRPSFRYHNPLVMLMRLDSHIIMSCLPIHPSPAISLQRGQRGRPLAAINSSKRARVVFPVTRMPL